MFRLAIYIHSFELLRARSSWILRAGCMQLCFRTPIKLRPTESIQGTCSLQLEGLVSDLCSGLTGIMTKLDRQCVAPLLDGEAARLLFSSVTDLTPPVNRAVLDR